jgi:hypothetical protein
MRRLLIAMVVLVAAVGCADNAILEITLDLPPAEDGRSFAYVQARSKPGADLLAPWSEESSISDFRLRTGERERVTFGVEASGDQIESRLLLKVRFCDGSRCDSLTDGMQDPAEQHFDFERAFYRGEFTTYVHEITLMPPPCEPAGGGCTHPLELVGKCQVFGCRAGSSSSGCTGDDGMGARHFCE